MSSGAISAAQIIAQVRLDNSRLKSDARQAQTTLRNLVRGVGTSSGADPLVNAIGRVGPGAALALVAVKALTSGFEIYNNVRAQGSARARGDIEEEVKLQKELNELYQAFPVVGGFGKQIRETILNNLSADAKKTIEQSTGGFIDTTSEEDIKRLKFEQDLKDKQVETEDKRLKQQKEQKDRAEDIVRTVNKEISLMNKSPRRRAILEAISDLEDYKHELDKTLGPGQKPGKEQQEALDALSRKVEAIKKLHGPAEFGDAVSAVMRVQTAILDAEEWGAKRRVDVAKKEAADKRKARDEANRPIAKSDPTRAGARDRAAVLGDKISQLRTAAADGDPVAARALRKALAEQARMQDITFTGSASRGSTLRAINRERGALADQFRRTGAGDPERDAAILGFEHRARKRLRYAGRSEFEGGTDDLVKAVADRHRREASGKDLDKAAKSLNDAGEKLNKAPVVGVIKR